MSSSSPEDIDAAEAATRKSRQVELAISMLLRVGVAVSLLLIVGGSIVSFIRHPEYIHSRQDLARLTTPDHAIFPHTIHETIHGLAQGEGAVDHHRWGWMLLIATPVGAGGDIRAGICL